MTEEEVTQGKSKIWLKAFKEARETTTLTVEEAAGMSFSDIMCYIGENKNFEKPVEQLPLINAKIEYENAVKEVDGAENVDELEAIWNRNVKHHKNPDYLRYVKLAKSQLERKADEPELDF